MKRRGVELLVPLEREEQASLFAWARTLEPAIPELEMLHSIPNTGGLGGGFAKNKGMVLSMIRQGMRKGYPDVGLDVAVTPRHGLRIEMKRVRGSDLNDPDQLAWRARLRRHGYVCVTCEGWVKAARAVADYIAPILTEYQRAMLYGSIPKDA